MWNGIKEVILIKITSKIQIDNNLINDAKKIVVEFNDFFAAIAKNIDKKALYSKKQFSDYLRNSNIN